MNSTPTTQAWRELTLPRPLDASSAIERVRALATDPHAPTVTFEARGSAKTVRFLVGTHPAAIDRVTTALGAAAIELTATRRPVTTARKIAITNRRRALITDALDASAPAILAALSRASDGEELVLQVVLGSRLSGLVVPSEARQPVPARYLLTGSDGRMNNESRTALAKKVCEPGFAATVRVGVTAKTATRRRDLLLGLLGALRRLEAPGVSIYLARVKPQHLDDAARPRRWPLRLNVAEVAAITGLPVGDDDLPGLASRHPKPLTPMTGPFLASDNRLVVGEATAPGVVGLPDSDGNATTPVLTITENALLRHLLVTGPTGVGKSVLLENLVLQHIERGHGAVVIEPKGSLVNDVLARIPEHRRGDVVVLDTTNPHGVVGMNPLAGDASPELRADAVLSVFVDMFGENLGVRSADILHACLLTLAHHECTSLVQIPRLLSDPGFRSRMVTPVAGDVALGPFWAWYEALSDTNRATVTAPLGNKLRTVLLKQSIRTVLGQAEPRFDVRQVFRDNKILLVPLPVAALGQEGASLLGSLIVAAVWTAARQGTQIPERMRRPVMICLDEFQNYCRLPDIEDALATSRGYGVGWVLAHQYEKQLPASVQAAVRANVRSRVVFQLARDDAASFAAGAVGTVTQRPEAEDFTALPAFHVYASLMESGQVQPYASGKTFPSRPATVDPAELRRSSALRFGRPIADIEVSYSAAASHDTAKTAPSELLDQGSGRRPRRAGRPTGRVESGSPSAPVSGREKADFLHESSPSDGSDVSPDPGEGAR